MPDFKESDWKYLNKIKGQLLERQCCLNLQEIHEASDLSLMGQGNNHQQYLSMFPLLDQMDKKIADCFDDWRRSTIFFRLVCLIKNGMMTYEEINGLSEETRLRVSQFLNLNTQSF